MLELDAVTVRFGGLTALSGISFQIKRGEILGLVGPNGAGKTTLFNCISGLVKARGRIAFEGRDIIGLPLHKRARAGIGRTFQITQPMHHLSVRENLTVAQVFGAGRFDPVRIGEILEVMELSHKADLDAATSLALQELKRLEIAKALATEPKLLLLDEVLAGLESNAKRLFMLKLKELHRLFGLTIVIVEHDIETISELCTRAVVLSFGQLIADGAPEEVFRDPAVMESYTGTAHA
ncbi:Branched-chain amino acid transport ATP-binding protein livG (plasmid) [Roseomonas mucosa]|uniref:Branched-chain amino acid transport ATP-binding protein livG n=1 Tax=Roseomonas mucosa TaxID=207340 RepID=A0A4Y1MTD3_9PROT|nr:MULTISPECIES: ABC transporter ATP-binding protein [Roseomonas]AWV20704.1 Branched-chain amino acid transport ATP-binding protein livG [Roseomonas mucosa]MDT8277992.1 ABC transporter ATP-binding protein [Roseomonas mucosa]MDT8356245.1 ABC transporter ATP-binding protein [Roseomonas mucosa]USQ73857.1 ABC transporter ATP-binding protein [Roseomonas mucosa]GAV33239.1 lipopolysaccharide export system ATP-binding protein LptB [Roseomonas sp. TAS13]